MSVRRACPAVCTSRSSGAAAPRRRSDFPAILDVVPGSRWSRAAGQRSTGAGGRVTSLKYITAATRSVLAAAGADGALVLIAADPGARPHAKYVPPGADLARRRGAAEGGAGRVCAVGTPRPRTLRRGGAPAALAHRHRRWGRAALRPLAVRPLRCVVWAAQRRRRLRRGGQGSATASRT